MSDDYSLQPCAVLPTGKVSRGMTHIILVTHRKHMTTWVITTSYSQAQEVSRGEAVA